MLQSEAFAVDFVHVHYFSALHLYSRVPPLTAVENDPLKSFISSVVN